MSKPIEIYQTLDQDDTMFIITLYNESPLRYKLEIKDGDDNISEPMMTYHTKATILMLLVKLRSIRWGNDFATITLLEDIIKEVIRIHFRR